MAMVRQSKSGLQGRSFPAWIGTPQRLRKGPESTPLPGRMFCPILAIPKTLDSRLRGNDTSTLRFVTTVISAKAEIQCLCVYRHAEGRDEY